MARDAILDRGGDVDPGPAELDDAGTLGVDVGSELDRDRAELVRRSPVMTGPGQALGASVASFFGSSAATALIIGFGSAGAWALAAGCG